MRGSPEWAATLELIIFSCIVGLFVGLVRCVVDDRPEGWSWWTPAKAITSSIMVAAVVGLSIYDFEMSIKLKVAATAICSFVANDLIAGLKTISLMVAKDPLAFIRAVREMIAGRNKTV